jgi:hypothetical protein
MIGNFFEPWGKHMSGTITWRGEYEGDTGTIKIQSNHVDVEYSNEKEYMAQSQIRRAMLSMF